MAFAAAICVSLVVLFLAGVVLLLSRSSGAKTGPSHLKLTSVRAAMLEKPGWTLERAERAQREYVRDDLDQFWHQHILDTLKYATDCNALFGRMIHHNPHLQRGSEQDNDAVAKTRRLYTRTFRSGRFGSDADPADFSGCSACGAETSGQDTSPSDHGGHSGSDGGHGHSCGGHS
jgi:hypothetical protein